MARKKHHAEHHEEHADETWLIPYSDLLTLLLALFIVLFASSNVDVKKFNQMANAFSMVFANSSSILEHQQAMQQQQAEMSTMPPKNEESGFSPLGQEKSKGLEYMQESAQLAEAKRKMDAYIASNKLGGDLSTVLTQDGLMVRIRDTAVFESGSAVLVPQSERLGKEIAKMLSELTQVVMISGHTDNMPISTAEFPTNWELSSRRAVNFMKYIIASDVRLRAERFSATGYGEYRPIAPNDTDEGRAKNRRVEVLVQRTYR